MEWDTALQATASAKSHMKKAKNALAHPPLTRFLELMDGAKSTVDWDIVLPVTANVLMDLSKKQSHLGSVHMKAVVLSHQIFVMKNVKS